MSLNEFLNDKKYTAAFFLLALCFFLLDWYLFAAVGEKEEHIRRLETETALLENRAKLPKRSSRMPFLETLLEDTAADTVFSAFMESGCAVEEIKEEGNEKFHVFHVKGKGSFSQITAAFGIIKSKERWSAAELCALKREGNLLAYEVEVRAVRNRGTYEKRNIVLIGPMGTGKSRAAKILADGFDWQLADTDRMMERETGMRIADYYRAAGAEAFEEKEMALINRVRYYHEAVIAMGGNYPMTEKKFRLLSEHGLVILLFAKPYRLAERVRRRVGKRPTMDYSDVDGYVRQMLRKWTKWKDRVDLVINTTNTHPEQTALLVARYIDRHHVEFVERN